MFNWIDRRTLPRQLEAHIYNMGRWMVTFRNLLCILSSWLASATVRLASSDNCTCRISIDEGKSAGGQPLLLQVRLAKFAYPQPDDPAVLRLKVGRSKIRVVCPNDRIKLGSVELCTESVIVTCLNATTYLLTDPRSSWRAAGEAALFGETVRCSSGDPVPVARLVNPRGCLETGFELAGGEFVATISHLHVDPDTLQPMLGYAQLPRLSWQAPRCRRRPRLALGPLARQRLPGRGYSRSNQRARLARLAGGGDGGGRLVERYEAECGLLRETLLVSELEWLGGLEAASGRFAENSAPVWGCVAEGNWRLVEEMVAGLAARSNRGLHVWSGSLGLFAVDSRPLYLVPTCARQATAPRPGGVVGGLLAVPELLFKYVYDEQRHRGVVLLVSNDPFAEPVRLCGAANSSEPQPWYSRLFDTRTRGLARSCGLDDFAATARRLGIPNFPGARLLEL